MSPYQIVDGLLTTKMSSKSTATVILVIRYAA